MGWKPQLKYLHPYIIYYQYPSDLPVADCSLHHLCCLKNCYKQDKVIAIIPQSTRLSVSVGVECVRCLYSVVETAVDVIKC